MGVTTIREWTTLISNCVTVIAFIVAAVSLTVAARNLRLTRQSAEARFMLDVRAFFQTHHKQTHFKFRNGDYREDVPDSDWPEIDAYMGTLELCQKLKRDKLMKTEEFNSYFGYRVHNIINSEPVVIAKLVNEKGSWKDFIALAIDCDPTFEDRLRQAELSQTELSNEISRQLAQLRRQREAGRVV